MRLRLLSVVPWVVLCVLPAFGNGYSQYILNLTLVNVTIVVGLNLLLGYAGQFAFSHAALMGIGAYTAALLAARLGVSFWIALPLAGVVSAVIGSLAAVQAMRLRRVYLALVTIAFAELIVWVFTNWRSVTLGTDGVSLPAPSLFGWDINSGTRIYFVVLACTAMMWWLARRILGSHVGRSFIAIRENEILAQCSGINVPLTKTVAFALSAFYAGIGGALFALVLGFIVPSSFDLLTLITQFAAVVLGGQMSLIGSAIGAALLTILPEALRDFQGLQEVVYGVVLIACVVFMPRGIAGVLQHFGVLPVEVLARHWRALQPSAATPQPMRPPVGDGSQ
ncbi:MAG: branched-chain amino acid ABC transporter permease [Acetobacteraceae bacterium]